MRNDQGRDGQGRSMWQGALSVLVSHATLLIFHPSWPVSRCLICGLAPISIAHGFQGSYQQNSKPGSFLVLEFVEALASVYIDRP